VTVEDSTVLDLTPLARAGAFRPGAAGVVRWTWLGLPSGSAAYHVEAAGAGLVLHLHYRWLRSWVLALAPGPCGEEAALAVRLEATPLPFGRFRWWGRCPLLAPGGHPGRRRVAKLYQPPRARYFGCRVCHRLSYASCRERRTKVERLRKDPAALAAAPDPAASADWGQSVRFLRAIGGTLRRQLVRQILKPAPEATP
jgi:hypothetical protein